MRGQLLGSAIFEVMGEAWLKIALLAVVGPMNRRLNDMARIATAAQLVVPARFRNVFLVCI
jgi:hypothetical protein